MASHMKSPTMAMKMTTLKMMTSSVQPGLLHIPKVACGVELVFDMQLQLYKS